MKTDNPTLLTLLTTPRTKRYIADLFIITLSAGTVARLTNASSNISNGADTYLSGTSFSGVPFIQRGPVRQARGLEISTCEVRLLCGDKASLWGESATMQAARGVFDGARLLVFRAIMATYGTIEGLIPWFSGVISEARVTQDTINMTVKSDLEQLNGPFPRMRYGETCQHVLYDSGCALSRTTFTQTGSITSATTITATISGTAAGQVDDYWNDGVIAFSDGQQRMVADWDTTTNIVTWTQPLDTAPSGSVSLYPGCDKLSKTCHEKFNNLLKFRGQPVAPAKGT